MTSCALDVCCFRHLLRLSVHSSRWWLDQSVCEVEMLSHAWHDYELSASPSNCPKIFTVLNCGRYWVDFLMNIFDPRLFLRVETYPLAHITGL